MPGLPAQEIIDLFDYLLPVARVKFVIVQIIDSGAVKMQNPIKRNIFVNRKSIVFLILVVAYSASVWKTSTRPLFLRSQRIFIFYRVVR